MSQGAETIVCKHIASLLHLLVPTVPTGVPSHQGIIQRTLISLVPMTLTWKGTVISAPYGCTGPKKRMALFHLQPIPLSVLPPARYFYGSVRSCAASAGPRGRGKLLLKGACPLTIKERGKESSDPA